jgi:hypothetical protein
MNGPKISGLRPQFMKPREFTAETRSRALKSSGPREKAARPGGLGVASDDMAPILRTAPRVSARTRWAFPELGVDRLHHQTVQILNAAYTSGSSVNSSCGCDTPHSAYRPTETRRRLISPTLANAADIRTG